MTSRVRTERNAVSLSDFEREIKRLTAESESINMLLYGDSNCGKTTVASTAPGNNFWFVLEPGVKVAARHGSDGLSRQISDPATAWAGVDWLTDRRRYKKFDWLIIDGLTTIQNTIRLGYTQEAFDNNPTKRAHRNLPDKPDYFNTQNMLKTWIGALVDLPLNLLITCHPYRTESEDGELVVFPGIQGKGMEVSNAITGLMDVTAYMEKKRVKVRGSERRKQVYRAWFDSPERTGRDESNVRYICGDKFGVLGTRMDSPTMPRILAKINGEETA